MAKMYYNEQEAAEKLKISESDLLDKVRAGDVHAYADGSNKMFKVTEIDQLAAPAPADSGESDIQLSPVEMSGTHTAINLSDTADATRIADSGDAGSDTVLTSEGISIFDDEDMELESADPMAKTQIAPSLEEGMGLEGLSSGGSGLLDLTRESDDTSLGSAVLDHIDMESGEMPSVESVAEGLSAEIESRAPAAVELSAVPMGYDPSAAMFTGMAVAGAAVGLLVAVVATSLLTGGMPGYVATLGANVPIVAGAAVGLFIVGALVGHVTGKKGAQSSS